MRIAHGLLGGDGGDYIGGNRNRNNLVIFAHKYDELRQVLLMAGQVRVGGRGSYR